MPLQSFPVATIFAALNLENHHEAEINEEHKEEYEVVIRGYGVSIEKSVPVALARHLINVIMGGASEYELVSSSASPIASAVSADGASRPSAARVSVREFLDECQATRNPDKITAIAEYLERHEGVELFTRDDIKGRFRTAGEAAPANLPRDFAWVVKNGWIAEDQKTKGSFYVTQKGRTAIGSKFSDEVRKATAQPSGRRRFRKKGGNLLSGGEAQ